MKHATFSASAEIEYADQDSKCVRVKIYFGEYVVAEELVTDPGYLWFGTESERQVIIEQLLAEKFTALFALVGKT